MKKGAKVILGTIMFIGIVFSILNFISVEINSMIGDGDIMGVWTDIGDDWECTGNGSYCDIMEQ